MKHLYIMQLNSCILTTQENYEKISHIYEEALLKQVDLVIFPRFSFSDPITAFEVLTGEKHDLQDRYLQLLSQKTHNQKTNIIIGTTILYNNLLYEAIYFLENGMIKEIISFAYNNPECKIVTFICHKTKIFLTTSLLHTKNFLTLENKGILLVMDYINFRNKNIIEESKIYTTIRNKTFIFINCVGLHDEEILYGQSYVINNTRAINLLPLSEDKKLIDLDLLQDSDHDQSNILSLKYHAIMYSLKYYMQKYNFNKVLLGLSGGIDSALTTVIAADALGSENVSTFMLSTRYTSKESLIDAETHAKNLQISYKAIDIDPIFSSISHKTEEIFQNSNSSITLQNIQSRIRGLILMALSNQSNDLLLATGNKSEFSVGYATIYGDMCGGFAPIKYLYKTEVYKLAEWRNENVPANSMCGQLNVISQSTINKLPSAELIHNQKDQDTLPEYKILDEILKMLVDEKKSKHYLISHGYNKELVQKIMTMIEKSEFKRKQSALGAKI